MGINSFLRPEIRGFEPYLPGKPIAEVQRELGLKKIVKLASNENSLGCSKKAVEAIRKSAANSFRYPEGPGTLLRRALAKHLKVDASQVTLGAGSDEIIEILAKTFFKPDDEVVVSDHAFIRYQMAADLMGAKAVVVPTREYAHDLVAMAEAVTPRTKAVFIANPNNPTGSYAGRAQVQKFFEILKAKSRATDVNTLPFVVLDEAYYEFARSLAGDYPESLDYFRKGLNVIVLRTFSKIYGLAGLRVGYGVAAKEIVDALDRVRPPFNVSNVAQAAAIAALEDRAHLKKSAKMVESGLAYLGRELDALGLEYAPSVANFLLVKSSPRKGKEIFSALLKTGVIIRAMDEYGYADHFRVTVGTAAENQFFIRNLKKVLGR